MPERAHRRKGLPLFSQLDQGIDFLEHDLVVSVEGFKAVRAPVDVSIAPLTIIAGTNSSGKSSFMQPLLLLKQTLEAAFDPGPLLLYGPNAKFTQYAQVLSRGKAVTDVAPSFSIGLATGDRSRHLTFDTDANGLHLESDVSQQGDETRVLRETPTAAEESAFQAEIGPVAQAFMGTFKDAAVTWEVSIERSRCFYEAVTRARAVDSKDLLVEIPGQNANTAWVDLLQSIIHVPGLRGNPEREYQRSAVGATYPGTFETYVASVILKWAEDGDPRLGLLTQDLVRLGLTWKVIARKVNDASVEVRVGRMPQGQRGGANDLVSVADVGFGVSQSLPVLLALQAARPGQVVYIEQPEIHLHPKAQLQLATCLVNAATRGVKVVAETHSSLLIRGIQTAVALGDLPPSSVSLNWFSRSAVDGTTYVTRADLDDKGRFGEWPIDFDDISQDADWRYLDAVQEPEG